MLHNVTHAHALAHTHTSTQAHTHTKKNNARVSTCTSCTNEGFDETYIWKSRKFCPNEWLFPAHCMGLNRPELGTSWDFHPVDTSTVLQSGDHELVPWILWKSVTFIIKESPQ